MNIREELDNRAKHVEEVLTSYLPLKIGAQMTIFDAMNYSISAGGKRIRPIILLEFCKICGGKCKKQFRYCKLCTKERKREAARG